jgi:hypothetical protein
LSPSAAPLGGELAESLGILLFERLLRRARSIELRYFICEGEDRYSPLGPPHAPLTPIRCPNQDPSTADIVEDLEVLSVRATADDHVLLLCDIIHVEPAAREQVVADRRVLGVWDRQRAEKIESGGTDSQVFPGRGVKQDTVPDAKLNVSVSAEILGVVSCPLYPPQVHRPKNHHRC